MTRLLSLRTTLQVELEVLRKEKKITVASEVKAVFDLSRCEASKTPVMSDLIEHKVEDHNALKKRSIRRFGSLDFGRQLESRSNEDEEDDSEDGEDDEDCDDESDDGNTPTYTVPTPKKVPSWNATESTKKDTTPSYTAPEKKEPKVDVSAGVFVLTGFSGGISIGASTYSGKATFFSQGGVAGACGTVRQDSDHVVAIDSSMYEGGNFCDKTIAVTRVSTGKSIHCTGADECPGCPSVQSLDLSIGAFNASQKN
ncbi:uncharacterized protein MELLADRAFT_66224 [Melampsora larici-populina 98AG31]|uniref:RlpA-like protein double-psi beta-barrel domain-containing protein n=1 Tax=Melampsora larici-populina (strain 98AG31 / pathotype 3-4-7) TaxID=747676 RepID=F4RYB4_MELLP|nr:uncharacterized protein MELLADRAFT_66224 [Melampsora larici-populina 98AG31]EGG02647.1 hypothetical protein MELLADRAFT_66224 [Melampsora larici-populina 98AG31]